MRAVIKKNYMKYSGKRYFKSAQMVTLGSYGRKNTPALQANYLEPHSELPAPKLNGRITAPQIVEIDTASTNSGDFKAVIKGIGKVFGVGGDAAWKGLKKGQYKFVHVGILMKDLKEAFNQSPKERDYFSTLNKERAVCEVFIVLEAQEAEMLTKSANFNIKAEGKKALKLTASGGASGSRATTVVIGEGTVYAYMLAKPDWENRKSEIKSFTDDQHGLY